MHRTGLILSTFVWTLFAAVSSEVRANLLTNGDFENPTFTVGTPGYSGQIRLENGDTTVVGWTATTTSTSVSNNATNFLCNSAWLTPNTLITNITGNAMFMNAWNTTHNLTFFQTFNTTTGQLYEVNFMMARGSQNPTFMNPTVRVEATGNLEQSFIATSMTAFVPYQYQFVATGTSTTLTFKAMALEVSNGAAPIIDNVSVVANGAVPEPRTFVLALLGGLGLIAVVRRRRKQCERA